MKYLTYSWLILLSLAKPNGPENIQININYVILAGEGASLSYNLNGPNLILNKGYYQPGHGWKEESVNYKNLNLNKISRFLNPNKFNHIEDSLVVAIIDGYYCDIEIKANHINRHFYIANYYQPEIDSIFQILNTLIPQKRERKDFHIPYGPSPISGH